MYRKASPGAGRKFGFKYENNSITGLVREIDEQAFVLRSEARELHQHSLDFNARLNNFIRYYEGALRAYAQNFSRRRDEDIRKQKHEEEALMRLEAEPNYIHSPKGGLKGGVRYGRQP